MRGVAQMPQFARSCQTLSKQGFGFFRVPKLCENNSQVVVGIREFRIELDGAPAD